MKRSVSFLSFLLACAVLFSAAVVQADDKSDAVKMVKDAVSFHNANGTEKTLAALNDPKGNFFKGELYVFAYDMTGIMKATVAKPAMVGKNIIDTPDSNGKKFRREIIQLAQKDGSGWVNYQTLNPVTKQVEDKTTYFEKSGDMVVACGIYKK